LLLDHYQPGTSTVLPPLVDRDITEAGVESPTVVLDVVVDLGSDACAAYVFSIGVDQQVAAIGIGYRPSANPLTPISPRRVYGDRQLVVREACSPPRRGRRDGLSGVSRRRKATLDDVERLVSAGMSARGPPRPRQGRRALCSPLCIRLRETPG
jgi:hypothetical protein